MISFSMNHTVQASSWRRTHERGGGVAMMMMMVKMLLPFPSPLSLGVLCWIVAVTGTVGFSQQQQQQRQAAVVNRLAIHGDGGGGGGGGGHELYKHHRLHPRMNYEQRIRNQKSSSTQSPFGSSAPTSTTTRLRMMTPFMISFGGFGGGGSKKSSTSSNEYTNLPRDVKDAVSICRVATQQALQQRISRMTIEFPVGTKFGVEKVPKAANNNNKATTKKTTATTTIEGGPSKAQLDTSDRELARLFVEMFQPVGSENIVVAFVDQGLADQAKSKWQEGGDATAACRVLALNRRGGSLSSSKTKKKKPMGFAAKLAADLGDAADQAGGGGPFQLPSGCEVAIFVAPGPKELIVIERICQQVGMGTLVILLNARLSAVAAAAKSPSTTPTTGITYFGTPASAQLFLNDFVPVFCLCAVQPQEVAPNGMLYRAFPGPWILARKPKVGPPKPLLTQETQPSLDECRTAFDQLELSEMDQTVENALENVANWFR